MVNCGRKADWMTTDSDFIYLCFHWVVLLLESCWVSLPASHILLKLRHFFSSFSPLNRKRKHVRRSFSCMENLLKERNLLFFYIFWYVIKLWWNVEKSTKHVWCNRISSLSPLCQHKLSPAWAVNIIFLTYFYFISSSYLLYMLDCTHNDDTMKWKHRTFSFDGLYFHVVEI